MQSNIQKIVVFLLFVLGICCSRAGLAQPASGQWPQFQGDAQHTGRANYIGPLGPVYEKWSLPESLGESSLSIGPDGTLYIVSFGGYGIHDDGTLHAINPDGTVKWSTYLGTGTRGGVAIDAEGFLYVAGQNGNLFAVDSSLGEIQWTFEVPGGAGYSSHIFSSPAIGPDGTIFVGSIGGDIQALDRNGNVKWQKNIYRHNGDYNLFWSNSPTIGTNGNIYIQSSSRTYVNTGNLFAFDYHTGELKWSYPVGGSLNATPTVGDNGVIYTGGYHKDSGGNYFAFVDHGSSYEILWTFKMGYADGTTSAALAPDGAALYLRATLPSPPNNDHELVKLDAISGELYWSKRLIPAGGGVPIVGADGTIYLGTLGSPWLPHSESAIALNPDDGSIMWEYYLGAPIWNTPAIDKNGTLYMPTYGGGLFALAEVEPSNHSPVADAGEDLLVSSEALGSVVIAGAVHDVDLGDSLECRWLEGGVVMTDWDLPDENSTCRFALAGMPLSIGAHTFTLEVTDGYTTGSDNMVLTVDNSSPHTSITGGGVYEVGTTVVMGGSVSDFDGDTLTYQWLVDSDVYSVGTVETIAGGEPVNLLPIAVPNLLVGEHIFALEVSDGINHVVRTTVTAVVQDSQGPTISLTTGNTILWPADHQMADITVVVETTDNSGLPVVLSAAVTSNEPANGRGDSNTEIDWDNLVIDQTAGVITLQLRRERSGVKSGREYTLSVTSTDAFGNSSIASVVFVVPHDQR